MDFDITWTITAIIAVSSFLSPIFVAVINNIHQANMRKKEIKHDEYMRELDLQQQSIMKQFDIYYADKRKAFSDFTIEAGNYVFQTTNSSRFNSVCAAVNTALLFCNRENQILLCDFLKTSNAIFGSKLTPDERHNYNSALNKIALSLNNELESTKPVIQGERRKH